MRVLIVNADDFGHSDGINRGIGEAHERGVVTSASLMVDRPEAGAAAAYGRAHPRLGLGLHLELGAVQAEDVLAELRRQLARFRELSGRDPTHLDSHKNAHLAGPARDAVSELGAELGVPVRGLSAAVAYRGGFYGQDEHGDPRPEAISVDALVGLVRGLPAGITELGCHPGYADPSLTSYATPRADESRVLCDPRVRAAIADEGIALCSFADAPISVRG